MTPAAHNRFATAATRDLVLIALIVSIGLVWLRILGG